MKRLGSPFKRRAILTCAALSVMSLPLLAWAQGSTPPAKPASPPAQAPAAKPATPPAVPAQAPAAQPAAPAAQVEQAAQAAAAAAPMIPDSAKAAFRGQVARELKQMGDSLKLTKEQKDNARPILLEHAYQAKQIAEKYRAMGRTPANREAMMKEMQTLREATDGKLAGVLSADQMTQYKAMREAAAAKMKAKMGAGAAKPPEKK